MRDCAAAKADAANLAEPWEETSRTFANGRVRIAVLDADGLHLLVLSPPFDAAGARQCRVVSRSDAGEGFAGLTLAGMSSNYHPLTGLALEIPLKIDATGVPMLSDGMLAVTIDQATGRITAEAYGS